MSIRVKKQAHYKSRIKLKRPLIIPCKPLFILYLFNYKLGIIKIKRYADMH